MKSHPASTTHILKRKTFFTIIILNFFFICGIAFCKESKVISKEQVQKKKAPVEVASILNNNEISFRIQIKKNHGLQKKAKNEINIYQLSSSHKDENDVKQKVKNHGSKIASINKFSGFDAKEDNEYFDQVNDFKWKFSSNVKSNQDFAVEAILYYCSFEEGICLASKEYYLVQK